MVLVPFDFDLLCQLTVTHGQNSGATPETNSITPLRRAGVSSAVYTPKTHLLSNENICFQSSFMLMTVQLFFFASAMSASLNVPIFDSAP
jgi:hypothetical protein